MKFSNLIMIVAALCVVIVIGIQISNNQIYNNSKQIENKIQSKNLSHQKSDDKDNHEIRMSKINAIKNQRISESHSSKNSNVSNRIDLESKPYDQAVETVNNLREIVFDYLPSPEKDKIIQNLLQSLLNTALKRKEFLNGVIDEFLSDPVSETGKYLKSVLAKIKDPEVEAAAQDMVESGDTVTMMIGLDLLGDLGIANPKTYDITSKILEQPDENSPEMLMRAIYAMPVMHLSDPETTNTIDQLGYLASNHSHDGVRSNSIFKIVKWAKDYQDLESVVQALDKNRSTDDRISAAMAISQSNVIDDDLRETLLSRMTDEEELWEIRRYAAESLSRFKLRDRDQQLYEAFRREQEKIKR